MADRDTFEYESLHDVESIVGHLQALADGLKRGRLSLASNGKAVVLQPAGLLRLEVEAKRGKHRARLMVKISWREDSPAAESGGDPLKIDPGAA